MNAAITRDPYNTAVAQVLKAEYEAQDFGEARLARATEIPRSTLRRYLNGDRDIPVAALRKIAEALRMSIPNVTRAAERLLKDTLDG